MVTIILFAIGFFITGGALGANIIGGFELVQYLLWFIAIVATFLGLVIFGIIVSGSALIGSDTFKNNKILGGLAGTIGGGLLGVIVTMLLLMVSYFQLWLSYYITDTINPTVATFGELPQNTQYAIILFFVIVIVRVLKPTKVSKD